MHFIDRDRFVSVARIRRRTGLSLPAIRRLADAGRIRRVIPPAGRPLLSLDDAIRLMEESLNKPDSADTDKPAGLAR